MSSGTLLLKQLQARQRLQTADQRRTNCGTSRDDGVTNLNDTTADQSAGRSAGSSTVDQDKKVLDSLQANERINNGNEEVTIEVCMGPDCSGGGGGAALLEIESLVMDGGEKAGNGSKGNIRVVGGGCRDYCTMGPNVHLLNKLVQMSQIFLVQN